MRKTYLNTLGIVVLLAVPAVAIGGGSTTYKGEALTDSTATIELKITGGSDRKVVKATLNKLPYSGGLCSSTGRTPKAKADDSAKVKGNGEFRYIGAGETQNPVESGQLTIKGDVGAKKVTGTMQYTFGKDGCRSDELEFKATK